MNVNCLLDHTGKIHYIYFSKWQNLAFFDSHIILHCTIKEGMVVVEGIAVGAVGVIVVDTVGDIAMAGTGDIAIEGTGDMAVITLIIGTSIGSIVTASIASTAMVTIIGE